MKIYNESTEILKRINYANNILLSLHLDADPDSIGSNLALASVLRNIGKNVSVISPDKLSSQFSFLEGFELIAHDDIKEINPESFDLYIALDSADTKMVTHHNTFDLPKEKVINIDHHKTNTNFGAINLLDRAVGSCSEFLYTLFKSWGFEINQPTATCLLLGIVGDTGAFRYTAGVTSQTFSIASELLGKGADYNKICFTIYQNTPLETLKFWGLVLQKVKLEKYKNYKFIYSAVSYDELESVAKPEFRFGASSIFLQIVENTDFGFIITEEQKGELGGSLRARTEVDVSILAKIFGGGGHKVAAGFTVKLEKQEAFEDGVNKIIDKIKGSLDDKEN